MPPIAPARPIRSITLRREPGFVCKVRVTSVARRSRGPATPAIRRLARGAKRRSERRRRIDHQLKLAPQQLAHKPSWAKSGEHPVFTSNRSAGIGLRITRDGRVPGLWTDAVDFTELGKTDVRRARHVEFDRRIQHWDVQKAVPRGRLRRWNQRLSRRPMGRVSHYAPTRSAGASPRAQRRRLLKLWGGGPGFGFLGLANSVTRRARRASTRYSPRRHAPVSTNPRWRLGLLHWAVQDSNL